MNAKALYLDIINNLYDGVYVVDNQRKIIFWNKAAENITGFSAAEVIGQNCQNNILQHTDKKGQTLCFSGCPMHYALADGSFKEDEVYLQHKEGHRLAVKSKFMPVYENGAIIGCVEIFKPLLESVEDSELVAELTDLALNDQLTKLYNRRYLENFIDHKINEYERFGMLFCLLFMDIDRFSFFNNTYGHETGDKVLRSISNTFQNNLRKADIVGRWGGEEFVGIFELTNEEQTTVVGEKIRMLVETSDVFIGEEALNVTVSIGITLVKHGDSVESLVSRSDKLMYQSKQSGGNCVTTDIGGIIVTDKSIGCTDYTPNRSQLRESKLNIKSFFTKESANSIKDNSSVETVDVVVQPSEIKTKNKKSTDAVDQINEFLNEVKKR